MKHLQSFNQLNEARKIAKRGDKYYFEVYLKKSTYDALSKIAVDHKSFKKMCETIIMDAVNSDLELKPIVNETGLTQRVELHFTEDEIEKIETAADEDNRSVKNLGEIILRTYINK